MSILVRSAPLVGFTVTKPLAQTISTPADASLSVEDMIGGRLRPSQFKELEEQKSATEYYSTHARLSDSLWFF